MSGLTCAGCGGPVDVQHKAGLPPCDMHPPVVAELRMHLSVEITEPIDWPARFRKAADVAEKREWDEFAYTLRGMAREMEQWMDPEEVEAIGRALLRDTGETVQREQLAESRRRSGLQWGPGRGLTS